MAEDALEPNCHLPSTLWPIHGRCAGEAAGRTLPGVAARKMIDLRRSVPTIIDLDAIVRRRVHH